MTLADFREIENCLSGTAEARGNIDAAARSARGPGYFAPVSLPEQTPADEAAIVHPL